MRHQREKFLVVDENKEKKALKLVRISRNISKVAMM